MSEQPPGRFRLVARFSCALILAFAGCGRPAASAALPDPLRVGVLPDQARERIEAAYAPLVRHLGAVLDVHTELIVPATYGELAQKFHRGEIDLAAFGGVTFVEAERRDGAVPIVMRIIDRYFTTIAIARPGLAGKFPADFRGRSFLFANESSTSGHRMPRYFLGELRIEPEQFFGSVAYLPTHDAVIAAVMEGRADVGVVNGLVLRQQIADGLVDPRRFRQVWESPPYADYVWVMPGRIPIELRSRVRDVFLALDRADPAQGRILRAVGALAFVPATREDFHLIRKIITGRADFLAP